MTGPTLSRDHPIQPSLSNLEDLTHIKSSKSASYTVTNHSRLSAGHLKHLMMDTTAPQFTELPITLLDLLTNPIIADNLAPYFTLSTTFRLARTARSYRQWILHSSNLFRSLDLSRCRGAYVPSIPRIDNGGHSWRAERMDENLTEDEFYAGPLRSVLNKLDRLNILHSVQTLVLDRLASVTHDLLYEIITEQRYQVKLLSIRQCPNVNSNKLQQLLQYVCRPSRPEGSPRLQGLYYFTDPSHDLVAKAGECSSGVTSVDGAALGLLPSDKSQLIEDNATRWYTASGCITTLGANQRTNWEETLQKCYGIISFDAVLCHSMHKQMESCLHDASREALSQKPHVSPIASIALGAEGCSGCGKAPEGTPVWGEHDIRMFPLLAPAPWSGKLTDAVRPPSSLPASRQRLIVACKWCLVNRHCDSCHRWWCSECYNPKQSRKLRDLEALSYSSQEPLFQTPAMEASGDSIKVFNGFCVENCLVGEMMAGAGSNGMWA